MPERAVVRPFFEPMPPLHSLSAAGCCSDAFQLNFLLPKPRLRRMIKTIDPSTRPRNRNCFLQSRWASRLRFCCVGPLAIPATISLIPNSPCYTTCIECHDTKKQNPDATHSREADSRGIVHRDCCLGPKQLPDQSLTDSVTSAPMRPDETNSPRSDRRLDHCQARAVDPRGSVERTASTPMTPNGEQFCRQALSISRLQPNQRCPRGGQSVDSFVHQVEKHELAPSGTLDKRTLIPAPRRLTGCHRLPGIHAFSKYSSPQASHPVGTSCNRALLTRTLDGRLDFPVRGPAVRGSTFPTRTGP